MKNLLKTCLALSLVGNLWGASVSAQEPTPSELIKSSYEFQTAENLEAVESGFFTIYSYVNVTGLPNVAYALDGEITGDFNISIPEEKLAFEGYLSGQIDTTYNDEEDLGLEDSSESIDIYLNLFEYWLYMDNEGQMTKYFVEERVNEFFQSLQEEIAKYDVETGLTDNDQAFLDTYFEVYEGDEDYALWPIYEEIDPQAMWEDLKTTSFYAGIQEGLIQAYDQLGSSMDLSQEAYQTLMETLLESLFYSLSDFYASYDKETYQFNYGGIMFEVTGETVLDMIDILAEKGMPILTSAEERTDIAGTVEDLLVEIELGTGLDYINETDEIEQPYDADDYVELELE